MTVLARLRERRGVRMPMTPSDHGWLTWISVATFGLLYGGGWVLFGDNQTARGLGFLAIAGGVGAVLLLRRYLLLPVRGIDETTTRISRLRPRALTVWVSGMAAVVTAGAILSRTLGR